MNIRTKLTLRFSIIVATILIVFSASIYYLSSEYRKEEFYSRLESRAITTARLFISVQEVDNKLLRIIDRNSIHAMFQEKVLVFNESNQVVYSSLDDFTLDYSDSLINEIRRREKVEYSQNSNEFVGITYSAGNRKFVVIASAYDRYGNSKLNNLAQVLWAGLFVGLLSTVLFGVVFSRLVLAPLARMNADVSGISAGNLSRRIDEGNKRDEIAQLAINFNKMLERIESAFNIQRQFVSSASHELRTPLNAISSQLQLLLAQRRSSEEYEKALNSLLEDARALVNLTNGLLNLAQFNVDKQRDQFRPVRVDEILFAAQQELGKSRPNYHFQIEYGIMPDEESQLQIKGDETLLKTAFLNLMDNACKFSEDHSVKITLMAKRNTIEISFEDKGIGIPEEDQKKIFMPFFRGSNARTHTQGHGIGLSLSHRIIQLHGGAIEITSTVGQGSDIKAVFPTK
ncbi:MAG: sensor histidine kinase [Bacteroidota bacterium]|jgi:signal transduction histidine kinase|nr:HAMP domain-containing histidine kinase [Saprospiraceae bacterium]